MALKSSQGTQRSKSLLAPKPAQQHSSVWAVLEARVEELVHRIKPSQSSDYRRCSVSNYVKSLIKKCFSQELEVCCMPCSSLRLLAVPCPALSAHVAAGGSLHVWIGAAEDIPAGWGY